MPFGADEDAFGMSDEDAQRIAQQRMARKQGPTGADRASGALSGASKGATAGATLGSVVPGVGTVAGAVGGGLLGALGGAMGAERGQKVGPDSGSQVIGLMDRLGKQKRKPGEPPMWSEDDLGGRQSQMGDWDLPPNDIDYA